MSKDELRPCIVKIDIIDLETEEIKNTEVHKALFHMWHEDAMGNYKNLFAVVEYEDGNIHFVRPGEITFTDRG